MVNRMEEVYSWIRNIVIYMIMNTVIMNLLGNKSYKKYISIVSGMILVLIVISPVMKLMKMDENLDYYLRANDFAVETSDFKNDLSHMEEEQSDVIFAQYKEKIRAQVAELLLEEEVYLNTFDVTIDKDTNSASFGEILGMDITADMEAVKNTDSSRLLVDEIEIKQIIINEAGEKTDNSTPSPMEITIKNKLSDFYNIKKGNININIQGGKK